jgi:lipoprotein-anchoring transpeptidase ErfK/SrfK
VKIVVALPIFFCAAISVVAETSVEIDLQEQRAYLLQNGRPVLASPISSGRYGHLTKTGSFTVLEKERNHSSSMYGKIVDANADVHTYSHIYSDSNIYVHPEPNTHSDGDSYVHADVNTNSNTYAEACTHTEAEADFA